ncbi:baseplate J/gp47 family protein [Nodularia spumigena CS-590/02]|uniref:baseplate J/gp47 family protein n=1 Tax=Nodularia spumigena TaxID=70799 RepID=UPI0023300B91|nr:baseplate J/gp47 family protein [Nodularia spumigena]MDB9326732.1 baseplate J/gp47 family protein [Nodularia spumigena CS-590/02]
MPIEIPNLDDRTYDDLVQEALSMIPTHAPEWTNHNPSDPGIMLIELFAYITEMLLYRLNRVTNANRQAFLNLIDSDDTGNKKFPTPLNEVELNARILAAVKQLRESDRAVTSQDYENLVLQEFSGEISRVYCVSRRNKELQTYNNIVQRPGYINLVIVPKSSGSQLLDITLTKELENRVKDFLENRRLLTTKINIYQTNLVNIEVNLTINLKPDFTEQNVRPFVEKALKEFLYPLTLDEDGIKAKGWEFGRNVYLSEIYQLLDKIPGVDFIEPTTNKDELPVDSLPGERHLLQENTSQLIGINIYQDELAVWSKPESQLKFTSKGLNVISSNS